MDFILISHKDEKALPVNCFYNNQIYKYQGKMYIAVVYEIHYLENLAIGAGGILPRNKLLGYHENDIERVIILSTADGIPEFVFLSAHSQEGRFYPYDQIEKQDNIPVFYAAKGSHALNNSPKSRIRMLGFANDVFSDRKKGKVMKMDPIKDVNVTYNIWQNEVLSTPLRSFLYPFYSPIMEELKAKQRIKNEESQK